jgi:hypothetical protein
VYQPAMKRALGASGDVLFYADENDGVSCLRF